MTLAGGVALLVLLTYLILAGWPTPEVTSESASAPESSRPQRLAVLELRNLSPNEDIDWMIAGLTEELRRQIGQWNRFQVLPGALTRDRSVQDLEGEANVVIDGYLQTEGDDVTVHVEVVGLGDGRRQDITFTGSLSEKYLLQRQVAANVARVFNESPAANLNAPSNPQAYPSYYRYLHVGGYGELDKQLYWLERTLADDPAWAWAWAWGWSELAARRWQFFYHLNDPEQLAAAWEARDEGRRINPDLDWVVSSTRCLWRRAISTERSVPCGNLGFLGHFIRGSCWCRVCTPKPKWCWLVLRRILPMTRRLGNCSKGLARTWAIFGVPGWRSSVWRR